MKNVVRSIAVIFAVMFLSVGVANASALSNLVGAHNVVNGVCPSAEPTNIPACVSAVNLIISNCEGAGKPASLCDQLWKLGVVPASNVGATKFCQDSGASDVTECAREFNDAFAACKC